MTFLDIYLKSTKIQILVRGFNKKNYSLRKINVKGYL